MGVLELLRSGYHESFWVFVLITLILGGGAAYLTGRAIAAAWRPWWHVAVLTLLIGAAVRFLHFALFEATLRSLPSYVLDFAVCLLFGLLGFRLMRVSQMITAYDWINERAGVFQWRRRGAANSAESG